MTKFEALIACRNHWQWLCITGSFNKRTYTPSLGWTDSCACCEYSSSGDLKSCNHCPLLGTAWSSRCFELDGIYGKWVLSKSTEMKKFYASKMVSACNRAIEDMIINGEV